MEINGWIHTWYPTNNRFLLRLAINWMILNPYMGNGWKSPSIHFKLVVWASRYTSTCGVLNFCHPFLTNMTYAYLSNWEIICHWYFLNLPQIDVRFFRRKHSNNIRIGLLGVGVTIADHCPHCNLDQSQQIVGDQRHQSHQWRWCKERFSWPSGGNEWIYRPFIRPFTGVITRV